MNDPREGIIQRIVDAVLHGPGQLDPAVRQAAARGDVAGLSDPGGKLAAFVHKVARHAYQVTDEDIAALRGAGYSEDQIFEATISASLGQGLRRRDIALSALRGAR